MKTYLGNSAPRNDQETIRKIFKESGSNRNGTGFSSSSVDRNLKLFTNDLTTEPFKFFSNSQTPNAKKTILEGIMDNLDQNKMLIMHVSWYNNTMDGSVTEFGSLGGHVINVIGYFWKKEMGYDRIQLRIHDPMHDYKKGPYFKMIEMKLARSKNSPLRYEISGLDSPFSGGIPYLGVIISPK